MSFHMIPADFPILTDAENSMLDLAVMATYSSVGYLPEIRKVKLHVDGVDKMYVSLNTPDQKLLVIMKVYNGTLWFKRRDSELVLRALYVKDGTQLVFVIEHDGLDFCTFIHMRAAIHYMSNWLFEQA